MKDDPTALAGSKAAIQTASCEALRVARIAALHMVSPFGAR
jgi:hypothetical protein